jgi:spore maturation protein CgeB
MIGRVDYVWIDKGVWILPSTLDKIRAFTCAKIVHYSPDAHFFDNRSRHFYECIPRYDLIVTTKPFELAEYRKHGAVNVQLVLQGFDPRFAEYPRCESDGEAWGSDVSFVGHCQPHYARRLEFLARTANVSVYGPNWPRYARTHRWARRVVKGPGAWGDDYLKVLAHSRIVLGLLGKHIPETTTTRTFEIPALGSFLLAERTEEHQALFREGVEAEFFGDDCEMRDKVDYYLHNDDARRRIAAAGRVRCHQSGYSSEAQLTKILTRLRYV